MTVKKKKEPETVTTSYVARILGLQKRSVQDQTSAGVIPKVGFNQYILEDAVQAYIKYLKDRIPGNRSGDLTHTGISDQRFRKEKMLADRAEIELLKDQEALLPAEEVERGLVDLLILLKTKLRNIPERVAMQLAGEIPEQLIKDTVLEEIDLCLEELSQGMKDK